MAHIRQQIRDQAVTTLTGLTTTGSNVFSARFYPLERANLPGLIIHTDNEELVEQLTIGKPRQQQRQLDLVIEGYAGGSSCDDTLDTIAVEVETAIATDVTLNGLVKDCVLTGTEFEFEAEDKPHGIIRMTYQALYIVAENAPETSL